MAVVFASVAEERDGIATEPPVDIEARAASWMLDGTFVAVLGTQIVAFGGVDPSSYGYGEINMAVAHEWRGRGVGSSLMEAAIEWARERGLHKLSLSVWPHNAATRSLTGPSPRTSVSSTRPSAWRMIMRQTARTARSYAEPTRGYQRRTHSFDRALMCAAFANGALLRLAGTGTASAELSPDATELHALLTSLPLWPWMDVHVEALATHPLEAP